jgi:hypothetical protein
MDDSHRKARLQHLINVDYDGEQKRFCEKAGVSKGRLSQLLTAGDEQPFGARAARTLEDKAGLPRFWFENTWPTPRELRAGNNHAVEPRVHEPTPRYLPDGEDHIIPQYQVRGSMGMGVLLRDQPGSIHSWHVTLEWIQKNVHNVTSPKNLAIVTGFGDSMKPLYNPGDPLLVDTGVKSVDFDAVYFFRIGEEGFIKRLQRVPGVGLLAISENKAYRDWAIKDEMDFEVFARVVKVWRGEDY